MTSNNTIELANPASSVIDSMISSSVSCLAATSGTADICGWLPWELSSSSDSSISIGSDSLPVFKISRSESSSSEFNWSSAWGFPFPKDWLIAYSNCCSSVSELRSTGALPWSTTGLTFDGSKENLSRNSFTCLIQASGLGTSSPLHCLTLSPVIGSKMAMCGNEVTGKGLNAPPTPPNTPGNTSPTNLSVVDSIGALKPWSSALLLYVSFCNLSANLASSSMSICAISSSVKPLPLPPVDEVAFCPNDAPCSKNKEMAVSKLSPDISRKFEAICESVDPVIARNVSIFSDMVF
ncbi:hypothetical protein WICPIJ_007057 [Wickerhamomyces pijperi]|uniref:Uncharacterized protein n=1 Tax=Wickerhamomyces pijperi TaxID=599730 RepID=A0A9P8Q0X1_WICPI|nr:hypothetical protein WICPIJ_007057 [Wickerhamomyces pijperi]